LAHLQPELFRQRSQKILTGELDPTELDELPGGRRN
jgi:hypothetical protein